MHQTTFDRLGLIEPILKAIREEGYTTPTPIQAEAIPLLIEGRDLLGCAQTGTGKTAAFAIPILQHLQASAPRPGSKRPIRVLVLTPTRELAIQIAESFKAYGRHCGLKHAVIFGGVGQKPQTDALRSGIDILVATPGRLLDLMGQGYVHLNELTHFVLDEADRMLDMGFIHDVKRVIQKIPAKRQTLLFSATMPNEVSKLAHSLLHDPVRIEVTPQSTTAETVEQAMYFVDRMDKPELLVHLLRGPEIREALVFTRTKHGANKLVKHLIKSGIHAEAIHGNKSQTARQKALTSFKNGKIRVLVATDIAARGIDIDSLSHVINYEIPNIPETYVHRIGRTGRAGASGKSISFCDREERTFLRDITRLIAQQIPVVEDHPYMNGSAQRPQQTQEPRPPQRQPHARNGRTDYAGMTRALISTEGGAGQHPKPTHPNPHRDGRDGNRRRNRYRGGPRRGR